MHAEERWPPANGSAVKLHNSSLPPQYLAIEVGGGGSLVSIQL